MMMMTMIWYDNGPGFRSFHRFCIWHCASIFMQICLHDGNGLPLAFGLWALGFGLWIGISVDISLVALHLSIYIEQNVYACIWLSMFSR